MHPILPQGPGLLQMVGWEGWGCDKRQWASWPWGLQLTFSLWSSYPGPQNSPSSPLTAG